MHHRPPTINAHRDSGPTINCFTLVIIGVCCIGAIAADPPAAEHCLGEPFWRSGKMENEPVLFVQEQGAAVASGTLLFTPTAAPRLTHPDQVTAYVEGRDYTWKKGSRTIELPPGSSIPFKTAAEMTPPPGSPNTLVGGLWHEGHFFHDLQMQATYVHDETWNDPAPPLKERLTRTLATLRSKRPLAIVALGDSITEGYNASGFAASKAPPFQPPYPQLVADTLAERFGGPVKLVNLAKAGTRAQWGLSIVDKVIAEKPDLVILAFGMNHGEAAPAFGATMKQLLEAVVQGCPEADVILVASMTSTTRMKSAKHFIDYRDVLRQMETPTAALADVTEPWLKLLERKPFADLSGNNVNHPNDFGHRLYAHVVCELFAPPAMATP